MTPQEYVLLAMRTRDLAKDNKEITIDAVLGLAGETGEVVDLVKKHIDKPQYIDKDHLKKEIGDVLWYIAELCYAFNFNLDDIMELNISKLRRRYPHGFTSYTAKRKEGDI